ncbi:uncharacterized protein LOC122230035 [Panthera leo]|uniref:uncharacterized protein LOC122230035 n=1 Tax=Panthera leo TaxID=9689 RepID=UPI001C6A58C7|nr:uncharacterized protein LOC122230035 [Panthera leo]
MRKHRADTKQALSTQSSLLWLLVLSLMTALRQGHTELQSLASLQMGVSQGHAFPQCRSQGSSGTRGSGVQGELLDTWDQQVASVAGSLPTCVWLRASKAPLILWPNTAASIGDGPQPGWRVSRRPAEVRVGRGPLQQVQAQSVRAGGSQAPGRPEPPRRPERSRDQPAHRPRPIRRSGEKAGNRATSSLAPSLKASVLHLLRPGCGLLSHRPLNRGSRESRAWAAKRPAEGRERNAGSRPGKAPRALSRVRWRPRHLCGARQLRPAQPWGTWRNRSRPEGGATVSGPAGLRQQREQEAVLAGASSPARPL